MEKLKSTQTNIIYSLKKCDSKFFEIQHLIPKFNSIFDESITNIKEREQELKDEISKFSKELQDNVEANKSKVKSRFTTVEGQVDDIRKKLKDQNLDIETALASNQGQVIFETIPSEPTIEFDCLPSKVESFIPVEESTKQIEELFGSFKEVTIPTNPSEFKFEVLRTFTTDLPAIQQVIWLDETTAWISCFTNEKSVMRKVTIQDNNIVTTNETAMKINDMALTSDNDILLTVIGESDVKLLTGEIKTFLTVQPLYPYGIHATSDNHIIVGVIEPGDQFTPTDQSHRAIMVFDMEGKQKKKYQFDGNRQRLFTVPLRITTNINQDILVIDRTSYNTGRVVKLDRDGGLRWIYEGHPKFNGTKQFCPGGINTAAAACYIIVSDYNTHTLHVLSENGDLLTCKVMLDMGIMYPWGLNIDIGGKLWVGCYGDSEDSGAKLHIVKMSK